MAGARERRQVALLCTVPERLGDAEVQHLHLARCRELDVRGLQIAVNHRLGVRRLHGLGNLPRRRQCHIDGQGPALQTLGQRRPFHQLEDQAQALPILDHGIDGADVRMVERREQPRLPAESREPGGVVCHLSRQQLDGDVPAKTGVVGAIDLAHAPTAQQTDDRVDADDVARRQARRLPAQRRLPVAKERAAGELGRVEEPVLRRRLRQDPQERRPALGVGNLCRHEGFPCRGWQRECLVENRVRFRPVQHGVAGSPSPCR